MCELGTCNAFGGGPIVIMDARPHEVTRTTKVMNLAADHLQHPKTMQQSILLLPFFK